jgi:hypothetical protein
MVRKIDSPDATGADDGIGVAGNVNVEDADILRGADPETTIVVAFGG